MMPVSRSTRARACRPDVYDRPSASRSWPLDRSCWSTLRSTASYPCGCDQCGRDRPPSGPRYRSPWPSASAFRDRFGHRPGARSCAARHCPPSSRHRRRSACPGPSLARPQAVTPSRTPSRGSHGEAARGSSTTTNDREPSPGSPAAENRAATSNPNTATRCPARWQFPRNNQPCASGNSAPAALTVRPSSARNKAGMPSRQTARNRPRSGLPEAGRKIHVPASEASRPRSPSDRLADCPRAPSPCRQILQSPVHTESMKPVFVNGLLTCISALYSLGVLLGDAGLDPQASRRCLDSRRLYLREPCIVKSPCRDVSPSLGANDELLDYIDTPKLREL